MFNRRRTGVLLTGAHAIGPPAGSLKSPTAIRSTNLRRVGLVSALIGAPPSPSEAGRSHSAHRRQAGCPLFAVGRYMPNLHSTLFPPGAGCKLAHIIEGGCSMLKSALAFALILLISTT